MPTAPVQHGMERQESIHPSEGLVERSFRLGSQLGHSLLLHAQGVESALDPFEPSRDVLEPDVLRRDLIALPALDQERGERTGEQTEQANADEHQDNRDAAPAAVVGYRSPYPIVVTVVTAHHSPSPIDSMFGSSEPRSTSATRTPAAMVTTVATRSV